MLAKLNMNTHCVAVSRDVTASEAKAKTREAPFHDDLFVAQPASLRCNQPSVWWSELESHIQALPKLDIEASEVEEKLLNVLRTLGSRFFVNAISEFSTMLDKGC